MAKNNSPGSSSDRNDPKKNKSLATRMVIKKMPGAKYPEVAKAVKAEYGHMVKSNLFYMLKAKGNMKASRKSHKSSAKGTKAPMNTAALWVDAIKIAKQLLEVTGSVENATSLLKAVEK